MKNVFLSLENEQKLKELLEQFITTQGAAKNKQVSNYFEGLKLCVTMAQVVEQSVVFTEEQQKEIVGLFTVVSFEDELIKIKSLSDITIKEVVEIVGKKAVERGLKTVLLKGQKMPKILAMLESSENCLIKEKDFCEASELENAKEIFQVVKKMYLAYRERQTTINSLIKEEQKTQAKGLRSQKDTLNAAKELTKDLRHNYETVQKVVLNSENHPLTYLCTNGFREHTLSSYFSATDFMRLIKNGGKFDTTVVAKSLYKIALREVKGFKFTPEVQDKQAENNHVFTAAVQTFINLCAPFATKFTEESNKEGLKVCKEQREDDYIAGMSRKLAEELYKQRTAKYYNNDAFTLDKNRCLSSVLNHLLPFFKVAITKSEFDKLLELGVDNEVLSNLKDAKENTIDKEATIKALQLVELV